MNHPFYLGNSSERREITQEILHKYLRYDEETGELYNKISRGSRAMAGSKCGSYDCSTGYMQMKFNGKLTTFQRFVWMYHHGEWPNGEIDHINGDQLDNRIENLRVVSKQENARNTGKRVNNTSGIIGVSFDKTRNKWLAGITVNYKHVGLGRFENKEDAIRARKNAEIEYGFHKNHGSRDSYEANDYQRARYHALAGRRERAKSGCLGTLPVAHTQG